MKLLLSAALLIMASHANSTVNLNIVQNGGDVLISVNGSLASGFQSDFGQSQSTEISAATGRLMTGPGGRWTVLSTNPGHPTSFGTGVGIPTPSGTGDVFGIASFGNAIWLPANYTARSQIRSSQTIPNRTITGLGLTPGTYVYNVGSGATADSVVLQIGPPPAPAATTTSIPTLSEWGLILTASLIGMFAALFMRKGR